MQFSTKIDGFEQRDSQGFENSYNSYEQYPLEKFFIFTIYQNYTLALRRAEVIEKKSTVIVGNFEEKRVEEEAKQCIHHTEKWVGVLMTRA